jgi:hypothetical protein
LSEQPTHSKPKFYRTTRFLVLVLGIIVLTAAPTITYYGMSYNSVNGTAVQLVSGYRSSGYGYVDTFYLEIHVWSYATSLDTRISEPLFSLAVDSLPFATLATSSSTWQTNGFATYNLKFRTFDSTVAEAVGQSTTNHIVLSVTGIVSAGLFSEALTRSDSVIWVFST